MIYYIENLVEEFLVPTLVAMKCDFCLETVSTSEEMEKYEQLPSRTGFVDICPKCLSSLSPN